ncbi:hypothetical protein VTK56DRAFT_5766 [Thermocarpiscus australiensis]
MRKMLKTHESGVALLLMRASKCQTCPRYFNTNEELEVYTKERQSQIACALERVKACQSQLDDAICVLSLCLRYDDISDDESDGDDSYGLFDCKDLQQYYDTYV